MGKIRQLVLRTVGFIGAALFLFFFSLTFAVPDWVENFGASFIEEKVSTRLDVAIDLLKAPEGKGALARIAQTMEANNIDQINGYKEKLRNNVHGKFADAIAKVRDLDCECRQKWEDKLKQGFVSNIGVLQTANNKMVNFIQASYMDVVQALKNDIRIFTGLNALVFIALLLVSWLKPKAIVHLFLPGLLLCLSTLVCSYFYLFQQNWLLTILYSDYLGFGYLLYLGVAFSFLMDIVFNAGRVTGMILNAFFQAIGSLLTVSPC